MIGRHVAALGRSDKDQTARIKEKMGLASWDRGPLIVNKHGRIVAVQTIFSEMDGLDISR